MIFDVISAAAPNSSWPAAARPFALKAKESGHASDVIAYAAANANTNVEQMGEAMKFLAPNANSLGWGMEESAAAIMAFGDAGLQPGLYSFAFQSQYRPEQHHEGTEPAHQRRCPMS